MDTNKDGRLTPEEMYAFMHGARRSLPQDATSSAITGAKFPAGYVHLPRGAEAEWVKQLVAEQLVTRQNQARLQPSRMAEAAGTHRGTRLPSYARAAAWVAGADRWAEAMWRDLECQVGIAEEVRTDDQADVSADSLAGIIRRRPERHGRRVFRSSYMGPGRAGNAQLGTSKNRRYSSEAAKLPSNDSVSFSFRFMDVHSGAGRDRYRDQFFEVPN